MVMSGSGRKKNLAVQRREENRVAAFSQWTIAMYAWNKEEMQKGVAYPSKAFWNQLLVIFIDLPTCLHTSCIPTSL